MFQHFATVTVLNLKLEVYFLLPVSSIVTTQAFTGINILIAPPISGIEQYFNDNSVKFNKVNFKSNQNLTILSGILIQILKNS